MRVLLGQSMVKRFCDFSVAMVALILFAPLFFIISLMIYLKMGRPIFFTQIRAGRGGQPFTLFKFRSMIPEEDIDEGLSDAHRITNFGKFLRATSIDELPQLLNVAKGDMSVVGPRPLLVDYLPLYSDFQARRHEVAPGITGWAQVNGRNSISWEEKFTLDVWYVDNHSLKLDLKIIWLTMKKVLTRQHVSVSDELTMPKFTGNSR